MRLSCGGCGESCAHSNCKHCGKAFKLARDRKIFCSADCRNAARARALCTCKYCGKQYKPKSVDRTTFCSRACHFGHKTANASGAHVARYCAVHFGACVVCGIGFASRLPKTVCSRVCELRRGRARNVTAAIALHKQAAAVISCDECRAQFCPMYGSKHASLCSPCRDLRKRAQKRTGRIARRAMERAAHVESVDPFKVFERDGWACRLCGTPTPRLKRGTYDDDAPELDHVIPLAKGGEHTYANTQCACRKCNGLKGDEIGWSAAKQNDHQEGRARHAPGTQQVSRRVC